MSEPSEESLALVDGLEECVDALWAPREKRDLARRIDAYVAERVAKLERQRDEWRKEFNTLCRAIVGETGLSAIQEAERLRAKAAAADAMAEAAEHMALVGQNVGGMKALADATLEATAAYRSLSPASGE